MNTSSAYRDYQFGLSTVMVSELRRMEESRHDWLKHIRPLDTIADSLHSINASASSAMMPSLSAQTSLQSMAEQWRQLEQEQLKRMLDPITSILKHFAVDENLKNLIEQATKPVALSMQIADVYKQANLDASVLAAYKNSALASLDQTRSILASSGIDSHFAQLAKTFSEANKQWTIQKELAESVASLRALQDSIGKLTLPVIDWSSAATLSHLLGTEGIASQLAALGISADGSLLAEDEEATEIEQAVHEKGIGLSRKTMELMTLISFVATFLIPIFQELSSNAWQAKTDTELEAHRQLLEKQQKTLDALSNLILSALQKEVARTDERFVVLERVATIRSKPESGTALVGKLLPREVVQPIAEEGKWIEVRYYDWLRQDYHTGWVLKKYLKRVPANHRQQRDVQEEQ
ncbi:MAG: SH3 domain-containing protein [Gallionella sp.]|nr:SH3 domain-containing protein [Gallionella sp.]